MIIWTSRHWEVGGSPTRTPSSRLVVPVGREERQVCFLFGIDQQRVGEQTGTWFRFSRFSLLYVNINSCDGIFVFYLLSSPIPRAPCPLFSLLVLFPRPRTSHATSRSIDWRFPVQYTSIIQIICVINMNLACRLCSRVNHHHSLGSAGR